MGFLKHTKDLEKRVKELTEERDLWRSANDTKLSIINELRSEIESLKTSGTACVEAVMQRGIEWVDVGKMDYQAQVDYFNHAKELAKNETLINECNRLRADWARFAISEAPDFGAVRDMRMCVNALELLFERLASIPDPRRYESVEEPHAAI